tara:strand:+ start:3242 stop:3919 length:678 start_codon:yes stop_codon:yes gene_type:complete
MIFPKIKALIFMKEISERVPNKNIRDFCGKPLFYYILETLSKSKYIDEIIINTDSKKIAKNAKEFFDVTIHMRPDYLLEINSNEANLIIEDDISKIDCEYFIQTHSTNPLLKINSIDQSIETFFNQKECDSLFSVTPYQNRLFFENGDPVNHNPNQLIKTQELPYLYEENSCIYIFSKNSFLKNKNRVGIKPKLFSIDRFEAVDIDEMEDFVFAEFLMKQELSNE